MRVVTQRRLTEFSKKHSLSRVPLLNWYEIVKRAKWTTFSEIKKDFRTVDYVGNNRYVFNIKGNNYRLVVIILFISQKIYIRFIGTHEAYNKIDVKKI